MSADAARRLPRIGAVAHFLARARLSIKLALLTGAMTAVVVAGALWILSVETRSSARRITTDEVSRSQRTVLALQHRAMDQLSLTAALVTQRANVGYALSTYRLERNGNNVHRADLLATVARELGKLRLELDADLIAATDEAGRVVVPASTRDARASGSLTGAALATLPAVRHALDPARADLGGLSVLQLDGAFYQVAVAPVILDGFTLGALLIGERLDGRYLTRLRDSFEGEVVVASEGSVVASTLHSPSRPLPLSAFDSVAPALGARTATVGRDEYVVAALSLGETQAGATVRLYLLQPLTPKIRALTDTMLPKVVTYGALAVVVGVFGALLLARASLAPLDAFVRYIRAGTAAERLEQPFDSSSAALEVRTLNASFEQLMNTLQQKRGQLEARTEELSAANKVLTEEIRERARVERALRESEAQLRQSQKLEAIGTLAGGVAHDFNNLLTVISGFTQLAMLHVGQEHAAAEELKQVIEASNRAAKLTQQLLAFSRKQVLQPRVLDARDVIDGVEPMLRRLIGAQVELNIEHAPDVVQLLVDPGQLEQVLLNLVVNARDAMPNGGRLTIATINEPGSRGAGHGDKVVLRVTDTGVGMTAEVRERIFEPFFTTKGPGKGTGLGLSTVYGIVNQSGGTIAVDTALGKGTTFHLEFPRASGTAVTAPVGVDEALPSGSETVLLVEDEDEVRSYARRTLEECGYTVLAASNGVEALALAQRATDPIDVLLTDVVMPQMTGPQLVERFCASHPAPCVVYMSGYADDAIMQLEIDAGTSFLRKPFTPFALARTIREALDAIKRSPHAFSPTD